MAAGETGPGEGRITAKIKRTEFLHERKASLFHETEFRAWYSVRQTFRRCRTLFLNLGRLAYPLQNC